MEVSLVRLLFWKQESLACLFQNIITAKDDRIYMSNFSKLLKVPRIRQDLSFSKACSHLKHKWHRYVCARMHVYACVCVCVCKMCGCGHTNNGRTCVEVRQPLGVSPCLSTLFQTGSLPQLGQAQCPVSFRRFFLYPPSSFLQGLLGL